MIWFGKSFIKFGKSFINLIKLISTRTCTSARVRSKRDFSTRNLHWQIWIGFSSEAILEMTDSTPRSPPKTAEELTNTPSLHRYLTQCQSRALTTNRPICKRRRGTTCCNSSRQGRWRHSDLRLPERGSSLGSFSLSFIGKEPLHCTRKRTWSSGAKWTDSGRLCIITTTSLGRGGRVVL